jgi:hypothetical protein
MKIATNTCTCLAVDHGLDQGILTEGGKLSAVDLLNKVACFVKHQNNIFIIKRSDLN